MDMTEACIFVAIVVVLLAIMFWPPANKKDE